MAMVKILKVGGSTKGTYGRSLGFPETNSGTEREVGLAFVLGLSRGGSGDGSVPR